MPSIAASRRILTTKKDLSSSLLSFAQGISQRGQALRQLPLFDV
jgi:hypothetical protein